jgi:ankyrin repeat protein
LPRGLCFTREQYALVELLLEHEADPNVCGRSGVTPLQVAVRNLHEPLVDLLLKAGARANEKTTGSTGQGPLHLAAIFCNCGPESGKLIIRSLLEARANPILTCERGLVPRAYSVDPEVKDLLLKEELWWRRRVLAWIRSQRTSFVADLPQPIAWSVAQFL